MERQSCDRQYQSVLRPPVPELVIKQILLWRAIQINIPSEKCCIAFTSSGQYATFQMEYLSVLPSTTNNICLVFLMYCSSPLHRSGPISTRALHGVQNKGPHHDCHDRHHQMSPSNVTVTLSKCQMAPSLFITMSNITVTF